MSNLDLKASSAQDLGRILYHHDPSQLLFQLGEIVGERTYLRHGVDVRAGDVVLDVGANVGVAAAFFAAECNAGLVHCFEPVTPIYSLLRQNLRSFPACVAHNYGLGSAAGRMPITYYPHADAMSSLYADPNEDRARVRTYLINSGRSPDEVDRQLDGRYDAITLSCELRVLSSVLRAESLERVDLLKIDVEKAELDVLGGIRGDDWARIKQVVMEVHDERARRTTISAMLTKHGFSVRTEQEAAWRGTGMHMLYATRK